MNNIACGIWKLTVNRRVYVSDDPSYIIVWQQSQTEGFVDTQSPFSKTNKPSRMEEECLGYILERKKYEKQHSTF